MDASDSSNWQGGPARFRGGPDGATPLVSVVVAANRPDVLNRMLLPSLRRQTVAWDLRIVDAKAEGIGGCAAALNRGAGDSAAAWLMFVHQDVAFADPDFLRHATEMMATIPDLGVAGPVGVAERPVSGRQRLMGRWEEHDPPRLVNVNAPERPTACQTLDEMLLFVPRTVFDRQPFDADACPGWHLYGIDYSLSVTRLGLRPYVLPVLVHHLSGGGLDPTYFQSLRRVVRKHRKTVKSIGTPFENWPTRLPTALLKSFGRVRYGIRRLKAKVVG